MLLDASSREMLLEILQKRQIEERRRLIARNGKHSKRDFKEGKIKSDTAKNIIRRLRSA